MKRIVSTTDAPAAVGPYSQGVRVDKILYCSGQIGLSPEGRLVDGGVNAQARQALRNLEAICEAASTSLSNAVRTTVFLVDLGDFATLNDAYHDWFAEALPARATVGVAALPLGAAVEIDAIVWCPTPS